MNPLHLLVKRTLLGLFVLSIFSLPLHAQKVTEDIHPFLKKETANGLSVIVEGSTRNVDAVMSELFVEATGNKPKASKGLKTVTQGRYPEISSASLDYYYRVERAAKTEPPQTRVTLFMSSGNGNFLSTKTNTKEIENATEVLKGLQLEVTKYELGLTITAQNKVIDKAIKAHEGMVSDSIKLQVKLAETQEAIESNKVERANQLIKIEEEKQHLVDLQKELNRLEGSDLSDQEDAISEKVEKEMENVARKEDALKGEKKDEEKDDGGGY